MNSENSELKSVEDFIKEKAAHYKEPQRKGTKRGVAIGLSYAKYLATLQLLTIEAPADKAKNAGVSYGLYRKWRTEKEFSDVEDEHLEEYSLHVFGGLRDFYSKKGETIISSFLKQPIEKVATAALPKVSFDGFPTEIMSNSFLSKTFGELIADVLHKEQDAIFKSYMLLFLDTFIFKQEEHRIRRLGLFTRELRIAWIHLKKGFHAEIRRVLLNPSAEVSERKMAVFYSRLLEASEK
jgi:hypothetical protein